MTATNGYCFGRHAEDLDFLATYSWSSGVQFGDQELHVHPARSVSLQLEFCLVYSFVLMLDLLVSLAEPDDLERCSKHVCKMWPLKRPSNRQTGKASFSCKLISLSGSY